MKLSGELFEEIISQLVSDSGSMQHNKRREPRVGVRAQGVITPWTLDRAAVKGTVVMIRDLSPGGICIVSAAPMQRGFRFVLQLQRVQREPLLANYEVRYCKLLSSNIWAVGGKLVNLNSTEADSSAA
ncbi:MAG: PilZ domain-containing protein [Phycisphaerae bacterium]|nr:PilZ domain-containing protein [Phycisphaerae bacterium]